MERVEHVRDRTRLNCMLLADFYLLQTSSDLVVIAFATVLVASARDLLSNLVPVFDLAVFGRCQLIELSQTPSSANAIAVTYLPAGCQPLPEVRSLRQRSNA